MKKNLDYFIFYVNLCIQYWSSGANFSCCLVLFSMIIQSIDIQNMTIKNFISLCNPPPPVEINNDWATVWQYLWDCPIVVVVDNQPDLIFNVYVHSKYFFHIKKKLPIIWRVLFINSSIVNNLLKVCKHEKVIVGPINSS